MLAVMAPTVGGNRSFAIGARDGLQVELTAMGDRRLGPLGRGEGAAVTKRPVFPVLRLRPGGCLAGRAAGQRCEKVVITGPSA